MSRQVKREHPVASNRDAQCPGATKPNIRIFLRGPFRVLSAAGRNLLPRGRKARALLAYLCLVDGGAATRARLAGFLWDEVSEDKARSSLRQALVELSAAMGGLQPKLLQVSRDRVSVNLEACWVDVQAAVEATDAGLESLQTAGRCELLEDLEGTSGAFDDWLTIERAHYADKIQTILEARLKLALRTGTPAERRAQAARAVIAFNPAHEEACRVLMACLADMGERALALREFERCRSDLAQLTVEPSPETRALAESIRTKGRAAIVKSGDGAGGMSEPTGLAAVAVMPVQNLTGRQKYEALAAGLTEDILTDLALLAGPFVVIESSNARPSVRQAAGPHGSDQSKYVISPSIQLGPGCFRVNLRLIDRSGGNCLWADRYECSESAIIEFHTSFASRIAREVHARLVREEARRISSKPRHDRTSSELVVEGLSSLQRDNNAKALEETRVLFLRAINLDPRSIEALAGLGHVYHRMASQPACSSVPTEAMAWGRAAIDTALAVDPEHVYANYVAGMIRSVEGDAARAALSFDTALSRSSYAPALAFGGYNKIFLGKPKDALRSVEECITRNPRDPSHYIYCFFAGVAELNCGNPERATEWLRRSLAYNPSYGSARLWLAGSLLLADRKSEAKTVMASFRERHQGFDLGQFTRQWASRSDDPFYQSRIATFVGALQQLEPSTG